MDGTAAPAPAAATFKARAGGKGSYRKRTAAEAASGSGDEAAGGGGGGAGATQEGPKRAAVEADAGGGGGGGSAADEEEDSPAVVAYVCAREQQVIRRKCVLMRLSWACWLRRRERERALAESLSRGDREHLELTQVRERLQETEAQLGPWRERAEQMLRWREECERLSDKLSALERSYRDGTYP